MPAAAIAPEILAKYEPVMGLAGRRWRRMNLGSWIVFLILSTATICPGQALNASANKTLWAPPKVGVDGPIPRPTVTKEMIASLRLAGFPITLESTGFEEVQKRLGGSIGRQGEAGDLERWLCFRGKDTRGRWALWLTGGEVDGPAVTGFQWRLLRADENLDKRCISLPNIGGGVQLTIPIHPGMAISELKAALGEPSVERDNYVSYVHEHQEKINGIPYASDNGLEALTDKNRVIAINVWKLTTN